MELMQTLPDSWKRVVPKSSPITASLKWSKTSAKQTGFFYSSPCNAEMRQPLVTSSMTAPSKLYSNFILNCSYCVFLDAGTGSGRGISSGFPKKS